LDVWIGRSRQQAIVIRKGQTPEGEWQPRDSAEHYVRQVTLPPCVIARDSVTVFGAATMEPTSRGARDRLFSPTMTVMPEREAGYMRERSSA